MAKAPAGTIYLLKRTEVAVRACVEVALTQFDLTSTQFLVLLRLQHSNGMSAADLARDIGVRPQSITDLVGPLDRKGLLKRRESPEHRRIRKITLSAAGTQLLAKATPVASQLERELLSALGAKQLERLRQGLEALLSQAQAHDAHPVVRRSAALRLVRDQIKRPWRAARRAASRD